MQSIKHHKGIGSIGMGCVTLGREVDPKASLKLLDRAYDSGITFFDTAASYGNGLSETILGDWLQFRRPDIDRIKIATKIPAPYEAAKIIQSAEESLRRLKIETLDILYLHSWHHGMEYESVFTALDQLLKSGKVRGLGASNFNKQQLAYSISVQEECGLASFRYVQNNNNIAVREVGDDLRSVCLDKKVKIVTYSPLGAGFLTGKYLTGIQEGTRFHVAPAHREDYFNETAFRRLSALQDIAMRKEIAVEHIALAWALHYPDVSHVLIGAREDRHIEQAIAALDFDDPDVFTELDLT
ncbi:MAG: aldo/keto reductase [Chitinophagaceae bacterium]|nr:aldo/keto reductase [Chitinophagaceae bacterium]